MLETLQQIAKTTPFPWWREPKDVNLVAIALLLTVALGLILTTRLEIEFRSPDSGALGALLPSALGFAFIACIITSLCLRMLPFTEMGRFIPLSARCFRQFTLLMLLISVPFLLREIGYEIPTDFIKLNYALQLSVVYSGYGIVAFLIIVLVRRHRRLFLIHEKRPSMIKNSPRFLLEPILMGGLVSLAALLTTCVTLSADLPAWLAVVKPS